MNKIFIILRLSLFFLLPQFCFALVVSAQQIEFASSPNPVGSGARAMGMGGAFIAVADDATAASWNPGGLVQLKKPEISIVGDWFHRTEEGGFKNHPESNGSWSVWGEDLNYLSVAYPFTFLNRNMTVSLNYQYLYDFTREADFSIEITEGRFPFKVEEKYLQQGGLSAIGMAYCIQITPKFSFGFTLNVWDDDLTENAWETTDDYSATIRFGETEIPFDEFHHKDMYSLRGFNTNIGVLWRMTDKLTVGLVFKAPFRADVKHKEKGSDGEHVTNEKLDMPMSYGLGLSYRFSDSFTISADVYRTEWQDYILMNSDGEKTSPINGKSKAESDIDPTNQLRLGAEYLFVDPGWRGAIPLRAGVFYDPAPSEGTPDDYYGVSLGSGLAIGRFVFDIAYQYRFGNNVGATMSQTEDLDFSQDVEEHMIYSSMVVYF